MFRVNTFVTELLVLFHRGENSQDKQAAEEIHPFSSFSAPSSFFQEVAFWRPSFLKWSPMDNFGRQKLSFH